MSIILSDVSYIYNKGTTYEVRALDHVDLKINDGEFIGVIGHTGSGKSTLIQHLNGLLCATEGAIYYDGENIYDRDFDRQGLRTRVGMVFQYPEHQLFETTVLEDVKFGPKNQGMDEAAAEVRATEALLSVGFPSEYFDQSPLDLSGGQKRRVAIAGVLAMNPDVLVLDEPTAGLDPKGRDEILDLIAAMHKRLNNTVILVSHSMEDVAKYVDRIITIDSGKIFMDGTPREVFAYAKELEGIGLAAPAVTYFMHALGERGIRVRVGATTVEEARDEILRAFSAEGASDGKMQALSAEAADGGSRAFSGQRA